MVLGIRRFITVIAAVGVTLLLMGLIAVPVWAQTEDPDPAAGEDQYSGDGCTRLAQISGNTNKESEPFSVPNNTTLRVVYETEPANNEGFTSTDISVDDTDTFARINSVAADNGEDGVLEVALEAGRYQVSASTFEQSYSIVAETDGGADECAGTDQQPPNEDDTPGNDNLDDDNTPGDNDDDNNIINVPPKALPNTGGPSLLAIGFTLVAGAGLLTAVVRRR